MTDELQLNDPQTLYRRWENSQWSPFAIDLKIDRTQWPELVAEQRELLLFALSSLMVPEQRITTKFSGLVGAHGTEEEATFLATEQVDEAGSSTAIRRSTTTRPATSATASGTCAQRSASTPRWATACVRRSTISSQPSRRL